MKEILKKVIKTALYIFIIIGFGDLILNIFSQNIQQIFVDVFWIAISAYFVERIRKEKIGKMGWIAAGLIVFLVILVWLSVGLSILYS